MGWANSKITRGWYKIVLHKKMGAESIFGTVMSEGDGIVLPSFKYDFTENKDFFWGKDHKLVPRDSTRP